MELIVNDAVVFAATGGRSFVPDQPTAMFLHGAGMDHTVWALQTRYFAHHGYNVLAVDMPGHGRSAGTPLETIAAMADWVAAVAAAQAISDLYLVGHSMGALVAIEAAGRALPVIKAVAVLGAAVEMPVHPKLLKSAHAGDHWALEAIVNWGFAAKSHLGGHVAPGNWTVGAGMRLMEQVAQPALGRDFNACDIYKSALDRAATITVPTLVLMGAGDKMTPAAKAQPLIQALSDGHAELLDGVGHMIMIEAPDRTLDSLAKFFKQTAGGA
jgi:pimeloyl-ACP methyl ester carboxylesterase